jgi:hypothetical protein
MPPNPNIDPLSLEGNKVVSSCPRLSRASTSFLHKVKDVDGRDKPGHDARMH